VFGVVGQPRVKHQQTQPVCQQSALIAQARLGALITEVAPQHLKAAQALYKSSMRDATVSQTSLLSGTQSKSGNVLTQAKGRLARFFQGNSLNGSNTGGPSRSTIKAKTQAANADRVAAYVNVSQRKDVNVTGIRHAVLNELAASPDTQIAQFARTNTNKVGEYVDRALAKASSLRPQQTADRNHNLQAKINDAIRQLQHRAFLAGTAWETIQPAVREYLINEFTGNDTYGRHHPDLASNGVDQALHQLDPGYTLHQEGARFKAFKGQGNARLDATQIRTANGKIYSLINTPTPEQARLIKQQHGDMNVSGGQKAVLGKGGFGKVRFAQDMETGEIVAVKKFSSHKDAKAELAELRAVGQGQRFVDLRDHAHIMVQDKAGVSSEKSYIFTSLANRGDGRRAMDRMQSLRASNPPAAQRQFLGVAREYAGAVSDMHARGVYHHDIKPENFLHTNVVGQDPATGKPRKYQRIKIADYGVASRYEFSPRTQKGDFHHVGGTHGYFPPEGRGGANYQSSKHDAFSLGMTLLEMKLGTHPKNAGGPHLMLSSGHLIKYNFGQDNNCVGFTVHGAGGLSIQNLPLDREENVIARLLDINAVTRLTPKEAHDAFSALERCNR
jgi:hypothetical protein